MRNRKILSIGASLAASCLLLSGCGAASQTFHVSDGKLKVVATTPILGDLVRNVGGNLVEVTDLVPPGADPHTYEPTLHDVRNIVYADAAFSNHLLLEEQALIRTLDANLHQGVENTKVGELTKKYGANLIQLVEDPSLNTIWLGSRVQGDGARLGASQDSEVRLLATKVSGPGNVSAYLTSTFGQPEIYFNSGDGFSASNGYKSDSLSLPTNAHTHMSWAFTKPGIYKVHISAELARDPKAPATAPNDLEACAPVANLASPADVASDANQKASSTPVSSLRALCDLGSTVLTFAVGVDPHNVPGMSGAQVLSSGHMDVTVNLANNTIDLFGDKQKNQGQASEDAKAQAEHEHGHVDEADHGHADHGHADHGHADHGHADYDGVRHEQIEDPSRTAHFDPAHTVIEVPNSALNEIPANPAFRFLGNPGSEVYMLAQAVLGKHVHGEIDPHLWQSVPNAEAMVKVIRDTLSTAAPAHAAQFAANARVYLRKLDDLNRYIELQVAAIPPENRNLVTTHDAYGYFANEYGLKIAGYVTPNPAQEPSAQDLVKLTRTLKELNVPAVFIEPTLASHAGDLVQAARNSGVKLCKIYADTFTGQVDTYIKLMSTNAFNLRVCLNPLSAPPPRFDPDNPEASLEQLVIDGEKVNEESVPIS